MTLNSQPHNNGMPPHPLGLPELTWKALILGLFMAVILSVANAYLGLKAGMTISAVFPAAVVAMAVFRLPWLRGSILEENMARTTASVGEALVAGAIFTLPAFVMVSTDGVALWQHFHYWEATFLVLAGGLLGILFVILLRRTLTVDMDLPYPEGAACYQMVKAGQKGAGPETKQLFAALGLGAVMKILLDSKGIYLIKESLSFLIEFPKATISHLGQYPVSHQGGTSLGTPAASPALLAVGYIIGPKYAAINFSGGILAWLVLIPFVLFLDPDLPVRLGMEAPNWAEASNSVWRNIVRPLAVGSMLAASLYTLYGMRSSIASGFFALSQKSKTDEQSSQSYEQDLPGRWIGALAVVSTILVFAVFWYFTNDLKAALVASLIMIITSFLFSAVGGYLVGLVGNSNQPVSGLTLSGLLIAALVMVMMGLTGNTGIAATLGVATVVCCAACMAGDMIQDLKVGYLLKGTPWKMEVAEIIAVVITSFFVVVPILLLHHGYQSSGGIGGADLPAPQAGLMAMMAKGIIGGQMPWMLIFIGIAFTAFLITIGAPSPMLIAVGMYLPFETTSAIFVGGMLRWLANALIKRKASNKEAQQTVENSGTLIASGLIAGEAICGVLLSALVLLHIESISQDWLGIDLSSWTERWGGWTSLLLFGLVAYSLIGYPLRKLQR